MFGGLQATGGFQSHVCDVAIASVLACASAGRKEQVWQLHFFFLNPYLENCFSQRAPHKHHPVRDG